MIKNLRSDFWMWTYVVQDVFSYWKDKYIVPDES